MKESDIVEAVKASAEAKVLAKQALESSTRNGDRLAKMESGMAALGASMKALADQVKRGFERVEKHEKETLTEVKRLNGVREYLKEHGIREEDAALNRMGFWLMRFFMKFLAPGAILTIIGLVIAVISIRQGG